MKAQRNSGLSAVSYTIAGGRAGIIQTVRIMCELVDIYKCDPLMRSLALSLVSDLPQKDYRGEVDAIFCYVRDCIRYVQDINGVETLYTPDKTYEFGQGDCDDKSVLLATLLEAVGFRTMFKIAGYNGSAFEHVYVRVIGPGIDLHLDATEPYESGFEAPNATCELYVG